VEDYIYDVQQKVEIFELPISRGEGCFGGVLYDVKQRVELLDRQSSSGVIGGGALL
jgi:hypothetical protein